MLLCVLFSFNLVAATILAGGAKYTQVSPGIFESSTTTAKTTIITTTKQSTPTSPTSPAPTPTSPAPTPTPAPKIYFVNDSSEICILLTGDIKIVIKNANNPNFTKEAVVDKVTKVEGKCGTPNEFIKIHFFKDWYLQMKFSEVNGKSYFISEVLLYFDTYTFPEKIPVSVHDYVSKANLTDYGNVDGQGYVCDEGLDLIGTFGGDWNFTINTEIRHFTIEAFRHNSTTTQFNQNGVKNCKSFVQNNLIPIIVGSVLIALILIVLIAYLISRRRRRSGYESV